MTLCAYAVTTADASRLAVRGIAEERLRQVVIGAVAAIVGELPRAPSPAIAVLRRYDVVIRSLAKRRNAVLPVRFGSCFATLDELTAAFRLREKSFGRALRHVRGRVQMTVRVVPGSGLPGSRLPDSGVDAGDSRREALRPGASYLRARAAAAARERRIPGFDPVRHAVRRWVRDEQVEKRQGVASVYHLVPRAAADSYRRAAHRAAVSAGLDIVVTGPHPAYAFA